MKGLDFQPVIFYNAFYCVALSSGACCIKKVMTTENNSYMLTQLVKSELDVLKLPREGELVEGTLIAKGAKEAYFDLGTFGTGIVYGLEYLNAKAVIKELSVGGRTSVKIVSLDNKNGYIELSLAAAGKQKLWQQVKELKESGEIIKVKIGGSNSGGLTAVLCDLPAFLPVSQLSNENYPRVEDNNRQAIGEQLKKFVGQELSVKVIDCNQRVNKLIISEREITDQNVKEMLEKYSVGQVIDGIISGVADFGAFIRFADNPEIEGLIHISELDHKLIDNPKEIVKIDDAVKAKIIDIKDGRVSLSLKALKADPWATVEERYQGGNEAKGSVRRFNPFGAFVDLDKEIQGLIHVSEFGSIDEMKKELEVGKSYTFIINSLKPQEKRLLLKMKK